MGRIAIVSTYNENCGNASYTHVLRKEFEKHLDVDVISLDLFLLQKKTAAFRGAADAHIREIAERLKTYDYVNIQFEAGLYGATIPDILRRIKILIEAAPNLILTMHRIDIKQYNLASAFWTLLSTRSFKRFDRIITANRYATLYQSIIDYCKEQSSKKNVWIKVHTRRERRVVTEIYNFANCFDYPLVFLNEEERNESWARTDRSTFMKRHGFEEGDKIIGLFGYLSGYKGIETAIHSLTELPPNYKLALFGSQHPQTIRPNVAFDPYLEALFELVDDLEDDAYKAKLKEKRLERLSQPQYIIDERSEKLIQLPKSASGLPNLRERIRFMGSLDDPEFIEALRLCDVVALPYMEVGQSMSGVVVLAMEAGSKMLCASNLSFIETRRYFGDVFAQFDVGNYVELAQKASKIVENPEAYEFRENREASFDKYSIEKSIALQIAKFGFNAQK